MLLLDAREGEPWRSAEEVRGTGDGSGWLRGLSMERGGDGGEGGRVCAIGLLGLFDCGWSHWIWLERKSSTHIDSRCNTRPRGKENLE